MTRKKHKHSDPPLNKVLPTPDRPVSGFTTYYYTHGEHGEYEGGKYRPQNEKLFVEGMRSVLRGVKRMKKESRDFCGLFGTLHYSDSENWRKILAPRDKLLDVKMLKALLRRPPKVQCYCACFCP
uniref:Dehydration-responsive element-binding protein 2A n=1 Tax=Lygus hesperus TaxID=30085 RepID=A0A0A9X543_LYGHE